MAEDSGQEKTEEPTSKRLRDAKEKGDVARSKELATTILLLAAAAAAMMFGGEVADKMAGMMKYNFSLDRQAVMDPASMFAHLGYSLSEALRACLGFFVVLLVAAIVGPIALGGWNVSMKAMAPKFSRIDPLAGIKRMFSLKALLELFKALAKFLVVGSLSFLVLMASKQALFSLGSQDIFPAMSHATEIVIWAFLIMSCTMILISLIDVPFQIYDYTQKLKMTLQEVKDEMKNSEGKPEVKGRIRQLQREISQRKMMSAVPEADVVITNPTHYAVALKYDQGGGGAPFLVAKGGDFVALKIREIADKHDIPILSAPPLARAIYHSTEVDEEIPAGLFKAVAEILAYVFQLQRYKRQQGPAPKAVSPDLDIPDELRQDE
ncbi:flagellar biosynthesis protein FlhB [Amphritea sp. 2_MG-2023]|uniref:flagellar biosynthesis protein FlhB n=1 Tax=Amphritea TaxID=515417 RepID=UPI001C06C9B3|nr:MULTISPECIES: flagellar biosynthesis protein FlhB [Amphritea]MBU2964809.1 flagellar type III secretion system protein FlhB [Amphritea atlantica]MDO6419616.1 flagellar biosynthesis protein FlhB [Amphritea sp. 2_MG-2023]MDX2423203.1 flagellar biosynthesis protein FlhB [Amphritea sp.]